MSFLQKTTADTVSLKGPSRTLRTQNLWKYSTAAYLSLCRILVSTRRSQSRSGLENESPRRSCKWKSQLTFLRLRVEDLGLRHHNMSNVFLVARPSKIIFLM